MTKSWQKHKQLLYELYIEQKHKLWQVMKIMAEKHDFVACRRTYMKMFGRWGYQKNRKSRKALRGSGVSREINTRLHSAAEPPRERLDVGLGTDINTRETNGYNPTIKINDSGVTHQTGVLVRGSAPAEATVGSIVSHQAMGGGLFSPLGKFTDSDDLVKYVEFIEGVLLLNKIKEDAQRSGNPDPHPPVMSGYQQALEGVLSGDAPVG